MAYVDPAEAARLKGLLGRGGLGGGFSGGFSGGGAPGGLPGAPPGAGSDAAGRVPGTTNPIDAILGNMGGITGIQTGLTDNALQLLRKQYPTEFFALQQQALQNAQRRAAGDISDLLPEMWTKNAENAVGGGYSGSAQENTKRLRDMGLTRLALEKGAEESMKNVYGTTPTVHPQDMSGIIGALVDAQARADIMRGAPNPEAAYQRARAAAGGGGGGGGGVPGVIPGRVTSAGGGASKVDDILKRMGGNSFGPPVIARGTAEGGGTNYGAAPYGSIPYGNSADSYVGDSYAGPVGTATDFGGSLGWGGGEPFDYGNMGAGFNYGGLFGNNFGNEQPGSFGGSLSYGGDQGYDYGGMFAGMDLGGGGGANQYADTGTQDDYEWWL